MELQLLPSVFLLHLTLKLGFPRFETASAVSFGFSPDARLSASIPEGAIACQFPIQSAIE
jgi:hypothetical protein